VEFKTGAVVESAERCWKKEPATHSATLHRNRPLEQNTPASSW